MPFLSEGEEITYPKNSNGRVIVHILICEVQILSWRNNPSGPRPRQYRSFMIILRHASQSVGLLWTSDQFDSKTSTWQRTTITREKVLCPRRDWNPQSQRASSRIPTP